MNCNLLIVDDSPILRRAIKKVAKVAGIDDDHIFEAGNGAEALEIIDMVAIDLVLLDLNMPVMNGDEFAEKLAGMPELRDRVRVVIVSTESNKDRLERMAGFGVTERLHKPFEPEDLRSLMIKVLEAKG